MILNEVFLSSGTQTSKFCFHSGSLQRTDLQPRLHRPSWLIVTFWQLCKWSCSIFSTWHLFVKQSGWSEIQVQRSDTVWHRSTCSDCCNPLSGLSLKHDLFQSTVPRFLEVVLWWSFSSQSKFWWKYRKVYENQWELLYRVCAVLTCTLKEWNIVFNPVMMMQSLIKAAWKSECRVIDKRTVSCGAGLCQSADRCGNIRAQSVRSPQRKHLLTSSRLFNWSYRIKKKAPYLLGVHHVLPSFLSVLFCGSLRFTPHI